RSPPPCKRFSAWRWRQISKSHSAPKRSRELAPYAPPAVNPTVPDTGFALIAVFPYPRQTHSPPRPRQTHPCSHPRVIIIIITTTTTITFLLQRVCPHPPLLTLGFLRTAPPHVKFPEFVPRSRELASAAPKRLYARSLRIGLSPAIPNNLRI